jgi:glycosyltransferase involved in cell wall biosynthesis
MKGERIGFDARMWDHPGIGRYIRELSRELVRQAAGERLSFLSDGNFGEWLASATNFSKKTGFRKTRSRIYSVGEQIEMPFRIQGLDLLHVPHFNIPVLSNKPLVVTIHDLLYLHDAGASRSRYGQAYAKFLFRAIQKKASAILTVSEYTKQDLLETFPKIDPRKVFVTHEGISPVFRKIEDAARLERFKKQRALRKPFVLCVGTLKVHKNIPFLIEAMANLRDKKGLEHELVLVGRKDPRNLELLSLIDQRHFVRYLGELSDEEVALAYHLAKLVVLPSLWEGFGLPVLEAMACGTPVAASNRCSLPEVVGQAGVLFDPTQVDALVSVLYNILSDEALSEKMSKDGLQWSQKFSWKKAAYETLCVYRKVLS